MTNASPTKQLSRSERHKTILRGAAKAFARAGYAATLVEDLAAEAGITKLIVYKHFEGKCELYQAVLQGVHTRLAEEFRAGIERGQGDDLGVRALLTVAREEPDAFQLLFRHAAREPQFEEYAHEYRERWVLATMARLQDAIPDPVLRRWAAETRTSFFVEAVLRWLDHGDESRDESFVRMTAAAQREMIAAWSSTSDS